MGSARRDPRQGALNAAAFGWLSIATVFFHVRGWCRPPLYYAVQSGLSIGYGALTEPDDASKLFTIVHVLVSTVLLASVLGMAAESVSKDAGKLLKAAPPTIRSCKSGVRGTAWCATSCSRSTPGWPRP